MNLLLRSWTGWRLVVSDTFAEDEAARRRAQLEATEAKRIALVEAILSENVWRICGPELGLIPLAIFLAAVGLTWDWTLAPLNCETLNVGMIARMGGIAVMCAILVEARSWPQRRKGLIEATAEWVNRIAASNEFPGPAGEETGGAEDWLDHHLKKAQSGDRWHWNQIVQHYQWSQSATLQSRTRETPFERVSRETFRPGELENLSKSNLPRMLGFTNYVRWVVVVGGTFLWALGDVVMRLVPIGCIHL